ncbi:hypothetical protein ANAPC5_00770 [Anaplasma phagocytophilum]|nr:hypothetical protein ANAPC2_00878 [Anaplasma phagocytophilum]SBO32469.1 hypothetical protein ANAPC4_00822 [Anaplasma phagocytophilum]SCV64113.1 hypothetical protein ANAPC5_00770 [Anaplasma phagocytophilum]
MLDSHHKNVVLHKLRIVPGSNWFLWCLCMYNLMQQMDGILCFFLMFM